MKLQIDHEADALYLLLSEATVVDTREVAPGVVLDYNGDQEVVGVEMLYLSKRKQKIIDQSVEVETLPSGAFYVMEPKAGYGRGSEAGE